jgi:GNAT superfamily N-acetyltransferase
LTARIVAEISIAKLTPADRSEWEQLFRGYLDFYETSLANSALARTWDAFARDDVMHALGAKLDGRLLGIAHFLEHASTAPDVCYLQDLFTAPQARRQGIARTHRSGIGRGASARLQPRLLGHARVQRDSETALRQRGDQQRVHPLPARALTPRTAADPGDSGAILAVRRRSCRVAPMPSQRWLTMFSG